MFNPKTEKIQKLAQLFPGTINELEKIFGNSANIYIDWQAVIFAVSGKVAPELDKTGVFVFDIRKIREFICWPREIPQHVLAKLDHNKAKGTSCEAPKQ